MRSPAVQLGPLLQAAVTGDEPASLPEALVDGLRRSRPAQEALPVQAAYHRIGAWVEEALRGHDGLLPSIGAELSGQRADGMALHLRALATLARLAPPLDSAAGRWVVFKGPVLAKLAYRRPELRRYGDLDVLVERARFREAVEVLQEAGFRLIDRNWPMIAEMGAGQVHLEQAAGASVDLHWHVLFDEPLRRQFSLPIEDLIERAVPAQLNDVAVHVFDPADAQLHVALHAAMEGADRLLWLKDVEQLIRHRPADWDELVRRARQWKVRLPVAVVLSRSSALLGTPVPPDVLDALAPRRTWRHLSAALDRLFPASGSSGDGTVATLLARTARSSERASLAAFGRGTVAKLGRLAETRSWHRDLSHLDGAHPGSLQHPAGDAADQAAFFDWVSQPGR